MKRIFSILIVLFHVWLLVACSAPQGEIDSPIDSSDRVAEDIIEDTIVQGITTEQLQKNLDTFLLVDAVVERPNSYIMMLYDMEWYSSPVEELTKLFIEDNGDSILELNTHEDNYFQLTVTNITTEKGSSLFVSYGGCAFQTTKGKAYQEIHNFGGLLNSEELALSETLSFLSREEAEKKINDIITLLGITDNFKPEYEIAAFNYVTLEKEQDRLMKEDEVYKDFLGWGKISSIEQWSKEDDIYYIQFSFTLNDIPFFDKSLTLLDERSMREFTGEGIISVRGIERFSIKGIPYPVMEKKEEQVISLDTLLEQIKLKYNDIILTYPITIAGIKLIYIPITDISNPTKAVLIPAWEVKTQFTIEKGGEERQFTQYLYWDGVTGEEIR